MHALGDRYDVSVVRLGDRDLCNARCACPARGVCEGQWQRKDEYSRSAREEHAHRGVRSVNRAGASIYCHLFSLHGFGRRALGLEMVFISLFLSRAREDLQGGCQFSRENFESHWLARLGTSSGCVLLR
jgi:hypothetical protein